MKVDQSTRVKNRDLGVGNKDGRGIDGRTEMQETVKEQRRLLPASRKLRWRKEILKERVGSNNVGSETVSLVGEINKRQAPRVLRPGREGRFDRMDNGCEGWQQRERGERRK